MTSINSIFNLINPLYFLNLTSKYKILFFKIIGYLSIPMIIKEEYCFFKYLLDYINLFFPLIFKNNLNLSIEMLIISSSGISMFFSNSIALSNLPTSSAK